MAFNIFGDAPQSLTGLLGEQATQDLQKKALTTGLINAAIGYIAQPKNQRYGSALPYIGRALMAGQEGAQGVYQGAIKDYELQQKIAEAKRKQEQQAALQGMIGGITDPNERLFAQLAPEQFVTSKLKPAESPFAKIDIKDYTPESVAAYRQSNDVTQLRATPKESQFKVGATRDFIQGNQRVTQEYQPDGTWKTLATGAAFSPAVNINMGQEKAENKAVGEFFGKQYSEVQSAGFSAQNTINKVNRLNQLLEGVNTGKLTPVGVELASTAQSLGFNVDPKLGNKQAAEALTNEMALELRNPSGGAGMPGAMSDKDREFLKAMVPGIEKTSQGRKLISDSMVKLAKRNQEVAKKAREYRKKNGMIDEGFYEELQQYSDSNPLFEGQMNTGGNWSIKRKQ